MKLNASKLIAFREQKDITVNEMASLVGVSECTYNKYEAETSTPKLETVLKIAEVLEVSLDYLFDRTENCKVVSDDEYAEIVANWETDVPDCTTCMDTISLDTIYDMIDVHPQVIDSLESCSEKNTVSLKNLLGAYESAIEGMEEENSNLVLAEQDCVNFLTFICSLLPKGSVIIHENVHNVDDDGNDSELTNKIVVGIKTTVDEIHVAIQKKYAPAEFLSYPHSKKPITVWGIDREYVGGFELLKHVNEVKKTYKVKKKLFA